MSKSKIELLESVNSEKFKLLSNDEINLVAGAIGSISSPTVEGTAQYTHDSRGNDYCGDIQTD